MSEATKTNPPPATPAAVPAAKPLREPVLTRDEFLGQPDRFFRTVRVPEFANRKVRLRSWKLSERMEVAKANRERKSQMSEEEADVYLRAHAVQQSVVDEQGNLIFGPTDIEFLKGKGAKPMERLFDLISLMNALGEDEETEIEKN